MLVLQLLPYVSVFSDAWPRTPELERASLVEKLKVLEASYIRHCALRFISETCLDDFSISI